jgi:hypothetical protein
VAQSVQAHGKENTDWIEIEQQRTRIALIEKRISNYERGDWIENEWSMEDNNLLVAYVQYSSLQYHS